MGKARNLTTAEMKELLDRHMRCELEADLDGLMKTLADEVVWGRNDDPNRLVGQKAIRTHYEAILAPGKHDAVATRGWYDEERQSSATEYNVTINFENADSITFPLIACVDFVDGRMANEVLYFYEGRRPADLMPTEELVSQGEAFMKAKALSES